MNNLSKEEKKYLAAVKRLFNTRDGHTVLAAWKAEYVDTSIAPLNGDPYIMSYLLGKKEFVQDVVFHLKDDGVLDNVPIEIE